MTKTFKDGLFWDSAPGIGPTEQIGLAQELPSLTACPGLQMDRVWPLVTNLLEERTL